jgi:hypothetical protein
MKTIDVVEVPVPGFGDHRKAAVEDPSYPGSPPIDNDITYSSDAVGVGNGHRVEHETIVIDPGYAGHFSIAVEAEPTGKHWSQVGCPPGKHNGNTGADRPFPHP